MKEKTRVLVGRVCALSLACAALFVGCKTEEPVTEMKNSMENKSAAVREKPTKIEPVAVPEKPEKPTRVEPVSKSADAVRGEMMRSRMARKACAGMPRCVKPDAMDACFVTVGNPISDGSEFFWAPQGNTYARADENPFADPASEPLSTFGLDVDTTSYALMRQAIEKLDRMPARESVRVEEYVNAFKYAYPEPADERPIAVAAECGVCPWNRSHQLLRLGLRAKDLTKNAKLPPSNLTFLIDVSGSMFGSSRLGLAQQGLGLLVEKLRAEDHVAIVTYASGADVRLASTSGAEKGKIRGVIEALRAGGCTAGGAGIELAYAEAQKNFDKAANNRVILITDGDFNVGTRGPDGLEKLIEKKRESGIFLSVFGVGCGNFRDDAMKKLANAGNGNYTYLDSPLAAKKAFADAIAGTLYTVAKDVKLQVEFNPATVGRYRLLGYENRKLEARDFNDDKKDAGEIGSGHTMTALYEIVPVGVQEENVDPLRYAKPAPKAEAKPAAGTGDELCFVKLRWKKPDADKSTCETLPLKAAEITPKEPSEDFRFVSAVAEFALLAKGSKYKGDAKFEDVIERARGARGTDADGDRAEFIRLAERAALLSK